MVCARWRAERRAERDAGGRCDLSAAFVPASPSKIGVRVDVVSVQPAETSPSPPRLTLFPCLPSIALDLDDLPSLLLLPLVLAPLHPRVLDVGRDEIALCEDKDDFFAWLERGDVLLERGREVERRAADVNQDKQDG